MDALGRSRILFVEVEARLAESLLGGLREAGLAVEGASEGERGGEGLREDGAWDLVVLDWCVPCEDGLSVLAQYRRAGGSALVLLLTARDAVADRVRGLDAGADACLCKPFAFEELLAQMRALLRRRD